MKNMHPESFFTHGSLERETQTDSQCHCTFLIEKINDDLICNCRQKSDTKKKEN